MTVTGKGINRARIAEIGAREEAEYRHRTPKSAALFDRARQSMPLGVASSFQAYDPYPLFMTDARGSRIWDADGNEYIDFDMAFGVLAAGHSHPILAEALQHRVANGTCYTFPVEDGIALAEEIKDRFGADFVRFSNSGTEATMDAIRVARGYTGREKIIKIEGGYHGHHDDVLVSIQPPRDAMGPDRVAHHGPGQRRHPAQPDRRDGGRTVQRAGHAEGHPRGASRGDRGDHRRAGPVQHRRRAAQARLPRAGPRAGDRARRGPHLRRGQDRGRARLGWRLRVLRRQARPLLPGQEHRRRDPDRRLRRASRGDGRHRDAGGQPALRGDGRCDRREHRALDDSRQRDARGPPRDLQRQPAVDDGRARDADPDPDEGRLPGTARPRRPADRRLPGGDRRVRAPRPTRSTSARRAASCSPRIA